jgi:hypothetical protein
MLDYIVLSWSIGTQFLLKQISRVVSMPKGAILGVGQESLNSCVIESAGLGLDIIKELLGSSWKAISTTT